MRKYYGTFCNWNCSSNCCVGLWYQISKSETPAPAPVQAPTPKAPAPKADANDNGIVSKTELNKLTKVQLFDLAEKQSLKVKKSGTKTTVVSEIWSQLRQK